MKRLYTEKWKGKRTTITIDPKLKEKIEKLLQRGGTIGEFVRNAVDQDIWSKEDRKRSEMSSTEQYHKLKQVEHDVEELKWKSDRQKEIFTIIEEELKKKLAPFEADKKWDEKIDREVKEIEKADPVFTRMYYEIMDKAMKKMRKDLNNLSLKRTTKDHKQH